MIEGLTVGPIDERCYILPTETAGLCILVDPGDEAERILARIDARHERVALVVATHGHLDHTAALPGLLHLLADRGPAPLIAVHRKDTAYFGPQAEDMNRRVFKAIRAVGFFNSYFEPMPAATLLLEDGDTLPDSDWRVIHTPGHTAGSICLYSEKHQALISGDTLFRDGVGRTDGPDSDAQSLADSIERRLLALPDGTAVYPGHGDATSIGRERGYFP